MKAITVHAARQIGLEDAIGTLEVGKEADLTILGSNPYATDPEKLMAIKVSETWVAGEKNIGLRRSEGVLSPTRVRALRLH